MIAFFLSLLCAVVLLAAHLLLDLLLGKYLYPEKLQSKRAVSQILATILLIGMTIVLIAVLYALILPMFDIDTSLPWD